MGLDLLEFLESGLVSVYPTSLPRPYAHCLVPPLIKDTQFLIRHLLKQTIAILNLKMIRDPGKLLDTL